MADCIAYRNTNYFSDLMIDYLDQHENLKQFYSQFPNLESFKKQIEQKQHSFSLKHRKVLVESLQSQYENIQISETTQAHIESLAEENTFTVTTGHQLNLFTGPLYFLYKIISAINLAEELKEEYPDFNFVPVYWMASEDHDFEEINYFNYKGQKVQWSSQQTGAVGEFNTHGLAEVLKEFQKHLGKSDAAKELIQLFEDGYVKHQNLTDATRYIANELFEEYGLVIIDGNDSQLKTLFKPFVKEELLKQTSFEKVTSSAEKLEQKNYKVQVNPREINLFYLVEGIRERIIKEEEVYLVHNTDLRFSEAEILELLEKHPERFSPNVIMRPLYQEVILPNLCYIGGGGELAYWFELKAYFESQQIPFPVLLLRNSALLISEKQKTKLDNLKISVENLFLNQSDLRTNRTQEISNIEIDFTSQKQHLEQQFKDLYALAEKTDKSFVGAVAAQEQKQINGLEHLEKRLLKAQKRKLKDELERLTNLQDQLFPKQSLQERNQNFSEFYEVYGKDLIQQLKQELKPLKQEFSIIYL
ncbi:bacillithiol biosynthesis cysteine-adding enzyme BshC [Mesonia aestuariivivens]|uniref:Putative cysteine ligase BshC n=1 Tax=Mesonia aestuariivivens TaxID=2796128 RepID=A0ABS6W4S7_9FLAO|nr:bacillithiol biosynthesis cysteine-adding enzyme BshC [Mesonia aestuariivivens]MBW2962862.1 bacillithiol biosynthesis cysteine-adding enzyme BshC [Mesonia aestuariivivens]